MVQDMKGIINKDKKMVKEFLLGAMEVDMKVNSIIIIFMEKVYIDGVMVDNILETGEMIKWLEKVTLLG